MNATADRELAQAIEEASRAARAPDETFHQGILHGIARRRRQRRAGTATVIALVVTAGIAAVPLLARHAPTPPPVAVQPAPAPNPLPPADAGKLPDFSNPRPPAEVWPEAVRRLPLKAPDGQDYQPEAYLPDGRLLIRRGVTGARFEAWDLTSGAVTALNDTDLAGPGVLGVSGDVLVWYLPGSSTVYVSRLDGGGTRVLVRPETEPGTRVNRFVLAGSSVVWGTSRAGAQDNVWDGEREYTGLYRIPVTGGTPERIANSAGFVPSWQLPGMAFPTLITTVGPPTGTVWDLTAGTRREYRRDPGMKVMSCATFEWCGGRSGSEHPAVQRIDGSGFVELPGRGTVAPLAGGRFALVRFEDSPVAVWDLATGRVGRRMSADAVDASSMSLFRTWREGDAIVVLDLTRVA
jgi:hypothetical protein